ncbi:S1/P1 nuclease [Sphingomonas crusticola]|uniref:S1/P1 nuclease n=1 Tax=Sphingomonas crusticola TaxID=1697973 RepID=UPI000E26140F|nr:S1/P1 nuclease [Sphingomonas crusticola]
MIRSLQALLAAFALLLLPSPAFAWWEYGHETTAEVAMKLVQPRTRQSIEWLLKRQKVLETPTCPARTIEEASVWPDCIKTLGDRFNYAYNWHFQDVDICKPFDLKEWCADGNCVSKQIARAQRMVADRELPARDRLMALAFLVHFTGDLHQPLHGAEHDGDQGGNKVKVSYGFIPRTNLHSVWDGLLADRAISSPPGGADGILSQVPPADRAVLAQGSLEDWSRESWQLAKTIVYGSVIADPCASPAPAKVTFDQAKIVELMPALRLQVAKGGIRLARLLDEALDGNHPEVAHPPKPPKKG